MKTVIALVFLALTPSAATAQEAEAATQVTEEPGIFVEDAQDLSEFVWINRPIVVFADSPADPRFVEQMAYLRAREGDLAERDVVVLTDTDPSENSALRDKLHPRGFMLVIIGKDGGVKLRKPAPWDVREITRVIDKMPIRQQEINDRRGLN